MYRRLELKKEWEGDFYKELGVDDENKYFIVEKQNIEKFILNALSSDSINGISVNSEIKINFNKNDFDLLINSLSNYDEFVECYSNFVLKCLKSIDDFTNFKNCMECYRNLTKAMTKITFAVVKISTNFIDKYDLAVASNPISIPKNPNHCLIIDKNFFNDSIINGLINSINDYNLNQDERENNYNDLQQKLYDLKYKVFKPPFNAFINDVSKIVYNDFLNGNTFLSDSNNLPNDVVTISNFKEIKNLNDILKDGTKNVKNTDIKNLIPKIVNTSPKDLNFIMEIDKDGNLILICNKDFSNESFNMSSFREYLKTKLLF